MPPTADIEQEPLGLGASAKRHFQPEPAPREVRQQEESPAPPAPQKEPVAKESPTKAKEEPPVKEVSKNEPPPSEDEAVFGVPAKKAVKPEKAEPVKDEAFEKQLDEETKGMAANAQKKWAELRRSEKAAADKAAVHEQEVAKLREELKTAAESRQESKGDDLTPKVESLSAENESLKAQLADAEKALSITQVERSKRWRETVKEPTDELTKQAEEIAGRYEVSPKDILRAFELDPKQRAETLAELAADFKEPDRVELYAIAKDMDRLRRTGEKLREKAKEDMSALEDEERAADERTTTEKRQALAASVRRAWDEAASTFDFLNPNPAAPEWTAALANGLAQSENWVPGQDAVADGRIRSQAAQHPFLVKAIQHKDKTIAALTADRDRLLERIELDGQSDPDLSGGRDNADHPDDEEGEGLSIGQRVAKKFGK